MMARAWVLGEEAAKKAAGLARWLTVSSTSSSTCERGGKDGLSVSDGRLAWESPRGNGEGCGGRLRL